MAQMDKLEGTLSDGSKYIFYSKNNQQIFKDVTVSGVLFTVAKLHERVLDNPKIKHLYTLTAAPVVQGYAEGKGEYCITLDPDLQYVKSPVSVGYGMSYDEPEEVIQDYPHDTLLRPEEPQITFGMFVQAVQTADVFDFNHPEILKILGETPE
jgi:hypothetical protein